MTRPSQPPPGFQGGFVPPVPVYGVEEPDGTLRQARTVAEGAAAVRARVAASTGLMSAPGWRRMGAGLVDLAIGAAVAAAISTTRPVPIGVLVGVALGVTFFVRIAMGTATGGATPGRLLVGTRAVEQDGSRLSPVRVATREALVLVYVVASPWWVWLIIERVGLSWFLQVDAGAVTRAPVPQDHSTGTTVATIAKIDRARASAARELELAASRPQAAGALAPPPSHASPTWTPPPAAASNAAARPAAYGSQASQPSPSDAATAADPPRLAAAPFIPADPDPDVAAAQAASLAAGSAGGIAVHTMEAPELVRRMIAATIDYALIVSISGALFTALAGSSSDPTAVKAVPITLIVWFFLRPAAMVALTQTPGQFLMHYRVYAPRGKPVGLGTALLREAAGWGSLVAFTWLTGHDRGIATPTHVVNADLLEDNTMQARLSHDRMADTWPIRV